MGNRGSLLTVSFWIGGISFGVVRPGGMILFWPGLFLFWSFSGIGGELVTFLWGVCTFVLSLLGAKDGAVVCGGNLEAGAVSRGGN